jgi:oxygen-independent coproporphyrinogen-3 oxidase
MLRALRQRDLIRLAGGHLRLTRPGMLVSDAIIANLFPDLPAEG